MRVRTCGPGDARVQLCPSDGSGRALVRSCLEPTPLLVRILDYCPYFDLSAVGNGITHRFRGRRIPPTFAGWGGNEWGIWPYTRNSAALSFRHDGESDYFLPDAQRPWYRLVKFRYQDPQTGWREFIWYSPSSPTGDYDARPEASQDYFLVGNQITQVRTFVGTLADDLPGAPPRTIGIARFDFLFSDLTGELIEGEFGDGQHWWYRNGPVCLPDECGDWEVAPPFDRFWKDADCPFTVQGCPSGPGYVRVTIHPRGTVFVWNKLRGFWRECDCLCEDSPFGAQRFQSYPSPPRWGGNFYSSMRQVGVSQVTIDFGRVLGGAPTLEDVASAAAVKWDVSDGLFEDDGVSLGPANVAGVGRSRCWSGISRSVHGVNRGGDVLFLAASDPTDGVYWDVTNSDYDPDSECFDRRVQDQVINAGDAPQNLAFSVFGF